RDQEFYLDAENWYLKSLAKREDLEDQYGIAFIQSSLCAVTCSQGNIKQSRMWLDKSFENQNKEVIARSYFNLGLIEESSRQSKVAYNNYHKTYALRQETGDKRRK